MDDSRYLTSGAILDASPLIYLAKLDALDVLPAAIKSAWHSKAAIVFLNWLTD